MLEKMPSKVWEGLRVGFCPEGRIPSFEGEHRGLVSGSLAGRPEIAATLDTLLKYHNLLRKKMVAEICWGFSKLLLPRWSLYGNFRRSRALVPG
jgi:hypothetical protein